MTTLLGQANYIPRFCLTAILIAGAAQAAGQVSDQTTPRATFKVTVTADEVIVDRTYEFLDLIARRNQARARLGAASPMPELELILLVTSHPDLPMYGRERQTVMLRLDQSRGTAAVEYCRARCEDAEPRLARYEVPIATFLGALDKAIDNLERYREPERAARYP